MAVQRSCRVKERGDVNDVYGEGRGAKGGLAVSRAFFSIHFSGFSYEIGALREAEEICCQAFNVLFLFS